MLIEPTETESVETLDAFADALIAIAAEADTDPDVVREAPHTAPVRRLDEAMAARQPNLRWRGDDRRRDSVPGLMAVAAGRRWVRWARPHPRDRHGGNGVAGRCRLGLNAVARFGSRPLRVMSG